jgi:ectoine hydroxylase-related dioxygenase (phytanoyl-CoA dioxygenase family)
MPRISNFSVKQLHGAREAYATGGAVIVKQALSTEEMLRFSLVCQAVFAIFDLKCLDREAGTVLPHDPLAHQVDIYNKYQHIGDDVIRSLLSNSALSRAPLDSTAGALSASLADIFGNPFDLVSSKTVLRRQGMKATSAFIPWHRDAHAVQTAEYSECVNCWVPIQPVGIDRPSLQVLVGSNLVMSKLPVDYRTTNDPLPDGWVNSADRIDTAVLEPGDVLIFSHHTLHRTEPKQGVYPNRISGEFRFAGRTMT